MKTNSIKIIGLFFFSLITLNAIAQIDQKDTVGLNSLLKKSLYKTVLVIDDAGIINRKDNNGNAFIYNLDDVSTVKYDFDGYHNVIIQLIKGKKVKGVVEGREVESDINVIAFNVKNNCDKTIEIFKKLIKK